MSLEEAAEEEGNKLRSLSTNMSAFYKVTMGVSEFLATAILVFVACMGCVPGLHSEGFILQQSALTSGLAVMITIFLFGHVSGAHVNPLTTVGALVLGQTPLSLVPIYFVSQILGAVVGYGLLKYVSPEDYMNAAENGTFLSNSRAVCMTVPSAELTSFQALMVEMILSLILTFANCSSWDPKNRDKLDSVALKFGFLVGALIMAGGPYTGASMNPAKSFAPSLWNNDWEKHWVYWVGPLTSAVFGAAFYKIIFLKGKSCLDVDDISGKPG